MGAAFVGVFKGEDDVVGEELGAVGFADDFVEVYPDEGDGVLLRVDAVEVVFAVEVLDDLVEYFGDASDILGDTILHYAARTANETTIRRMLTFGLNRQALNNSGETPYDVAKRWNNKAGMELLK